MEERCFSDLRQLASFLASTEAQHWRWAEVEIVDASGQKEFAHYSADALRSMIVASSRNPSCN